MTDPITQSSQQLSNASSIISQATNVPHQIANVANQAAAIPNQIATIPGQLPQFQNQPVEAPAEEVIELDNDNVQDVTGEPLYFPLDRGGLNPLIDACSHLLALIIRLRSLDTFEDIDALYQQVKNEVSLLEKDLNERDITHSNIITASRFCLCAAIDESVLKKNWSEESVWEKTPLLSIFHRHSRHDDEFYRILSRLLINHKKYKHVIELFYVCLLLGYEGSYRSNKGGKKTRAKKIKELESILSTYTKKPDGNFVEPYKYQVESEYNIAIDFPHWPIYLITIVTLIITYSIFSHLVDQDTASLLEQLKLLAEVKS